MAIAQFDTKFHIVVYNVCWNEYTEENDVVTIWFFFPIL